SRVRIEARRPGNHHDQDLKTANQIDRPASYIEGRGIEIACKMRSSRSGNRRTVTPRTKRIVSHHMGSMQCPRLPVGFRRSWLFGGVVAFCGEVAWANGYLALSTERIVPT